MTLTQLLFSFKGRINRKPWWLASLAAGFAASLLTAILEAVARSAGETIVNPVTHQFEPTGIFGLAISLIGLVNAWIAFALSVKRLHDRDRTGWWLLWQILIIVVAVILIVVAISGAEGTRAAVVCAGGRGRSSRPSPSRYGCSCEIGFLQGDGRAEPLRPRPARRR